MAGNPARSLGEVKVDLDDLILGYPTKEYLNKFTKPQLQKYCSQLGLNKIWVTKPEIIDMILNHFEKKQQHQINSCVEGTSQQSDAGALSVRLEAFMKETNAKLNSMNAVLLQKDKEIDTLRESLQVAEKNIQLLMARTRNSEINSNSVKQENEIPVKKTLLLGDSSLKEINPSDLGKNTMVRTIPEANFDLLRSWVSDKLTHSLGECIIYCGFQDLVGKDSSADKALGNLKGLVAALKSKNEHIVVSVCELIPTVVSDEMHDKISNYNLKLVDWCSNNDVSIINNELYFRLGTGDIDLNCFECGENSVRKKLTRLGVIRLLDSISKKVKHIVCENWDNMKINPKNAPSKLRSYGQKDDGQLQKYSSVPGGRSNSRTSQWNQRHHHTNTQKQWRETETQGRTAMPLNPSSPSGYDGHTRWRPQLQRTSAPRTPLPTTNPYLTFRGGRGGVPYTPGFSSSHPSLHPYSPYIPYPGPPTGHSRITPLWRDRY